MFRLELVACNDGILFVLALSNWVVRVFEHEGCIGTFNQCIPLLAADATASKSFPSQWK